MSVFQTSLWLRSISNTCSLASHTSKAKRVNLVNNMDIGLIKIQMENRETISTWHDYEITKRMTWHLFGTIKILYIWYILFLSLVPYSYTFHVHQDVFDLCRRSKFHSFDVIWKRLQCPYMTRNSILDYSVSPQGSAANFVFVFWHF